MVLDTLFGFKVDSVIKAQYNSYVKHGFVDAGTLNNGLRLTFYILMEELKSGNRKFYDEIVVREYQIRHQKSNTEGIPAILEKDNTKIEEIKSVTMPSLAKPKELDLSWTRINTGSRDDSND